MLARQLHHHPAWTLADLNSHFYWGREANQTPWYPGVRVYRQRKICNWTGVFEEVRKDLMELSRLPRKPAGSDG